MFTHGGTYWVKSYVARFHDGKKGFLLVFGPSFFFGVGMHGSVSTSTYIILKIMGMIQVYNFPI